VVDMQGGNINILISSAICRLIKEYCTGTSSTSLLFFHSQLFHKFKSVIM